MIRALSMQISVIYIEPSYKLNVGCWLSSILINLGKFLGGYGISSKVMRLKFEPKAKDRI